jgi:D-alanyl-D-alanine carboxypeptidase
MEEMRMGKRVLRNHNPLLRSYEGADGMKTGFICDSGFNLVASASRDGQKLVAVVLGETTGGNRSARAANLLEHGFQTLPWKALFGTESLDTLPLAADAKSAVSIRQTVISWACGTGRRRAVARAKNKAKRGAVATAAKSKAGPAKKAPAAAE